MNLLKVVKSLLILTIALGLFGSAVAARSDENTRPRRVTAEGETAGTENGTQGERRTGVTVTRKRRHGVVHRSATGAAQGTAKGATVAAEKSAEGGEVAGKSTAKGAKSAARGTKKVGKKVIDAFK